MRTLVLGLLAATLCSAQAPLTLQAVEAIALERHPSLRQAKASVDAAEARRRQAGRYPNPTIGAVGDELNRKLPELRGGEVGAFIEQRIVTGGKLTLEQRVIEHERTAAEAEMDAERQRLLNRVRGFFYANLAAQRMIELQQQLLDVSNEAVGISRELANVGQADRPDVLQTEIEAQSAAMALEQTNLDREALWHRLAAATGDVSLPLQPLEGDLEKLPLLEQQAAIERILAESPEIDHAAAEVARAEARVARERVEIVPDIKAEGGFRYNPATFIRGQPIGREGFFQVGVEIPLFDRNRGGVAEARADLEHAQADVELVKLSLHDRLAVAYGQYAASSALAARYRDEMLPRAREAYQLYLDGFRRMAAAYPQALIAKRSLVELERDYMRALNSAWQAAIAIDGLLLTD